MPLYGCASAIASKLALLSASSYIWLRHIYGCASAEQINLFCSQLLRIFAHGFWICWLLLPPVPIALNFQNNFYFDFIWFIQVQQMCCVKKGPNHGPAPIPEEGKWVKSKEITDISGLTHGIGWCAPQQGACKLTLNVKEGIIQEALVETIGCSGMTHSAAMASEILPGKTVLEALNTDLVCDAINTAMRELFLQIVYGRTQSAFSEGGLMIGAGLEDLGKGLRSQVGTLYGTLAKGPRYLEMAEGYIKTIALDKNDEICGYEFVHLGKFMDLVKKGVDANEALKQVTGSYGRFTKEAGAVKYIDPRKE